MLESIFIFIIFLGPLVFFHELGHYLFARLFGVRVEVFSLGFGPKILKFKKGDTQYAVSLVPLGGYVKMFGDDPLNKDAIPEEERPFSFTHKGKWARFWIVMGGPLANFIMAYAIFFGLLMSGEKVPEIRAGVLSEKSVLYEKGVLANDLLLSVNGRRVLSPSDIILDGGDSIKEITIRRQERELVLPIGMTGENFFKEWVKGAPPRLALIASRDGKSYALSFNQEKVDWNFSLDSMASMENGKSLYLFPIEKVASVEEMSEEIKDKKGIPINLSGDDFFESLSRQGYRPYDLVIRSINMNSPADTAGLKAGDVIASLNGQTLSGFEQLRRVLQKTEKDTIQLSIWRQGNLSEVTLTPEVKEVNGEQLKLIGVYSSVAFVPRKFIQTESLGLIGASTKAIGRTWSTIVKTIEGFKKLFTGAVSFKEVGGPLAIGSVATQSFNTSLSYFFQVMALISVNLGLINLFPIPVLDGGHILFIFLEILNRGPVSRRKMEIAQQIGLSLLLLLMVGALFNDYQRFIQ